MHWSIGRGRGISLTAFTLHSAVEDPFGAQVLNTAFFMTGYLGFLATWIMDTIYTFVHK